MAHECATRSMISPVRPTGFAGWRPATSTGGNAGGRHAIHHPKTAGRQPRTLISDRAAAARPDAAHRRARAGEDPTARNRVDSLQRTNEHAEQSEYSLRRVFNSPQLLMLSGIGRRSSYKSSGSRTGRTAGRAQSARSSPVALIWNRLEPGPFHRNCESIVPRQHGPRAAVPRRPQQRASGRDRLRKKPPRSGSARYRVPAAVRTLETRPWFPGCRRPIRRRDTAVLYIRAATDSDVASADPPTSADRIQLPAEPDNLALRKRTLARDVTGKNRWTGFAGTVAPTRISDQAQSTPGSANVSRQPSSDLCHRQQGARPELRVHGSKICGRRCLALPDMPSAHINAIVMMLAERAADLIRGRPPLAPANV